MADVKSGYLADRGSPIVALMTRSVRAVRGREPVLQAAGWLGDTASFGASVPTVIFGPGGEPVYCPDEHVPIDDLVEATEVYAMFGALALGAGSGG